MNDKNYYKGEFIKNESFYNGIVYCWNLPPIITCPCALDCIKKHGQYRCYALNDKIEHQIIAKNNLKFILDGGIPEIPNGCKSVRIHSTGDFFNQKYFDLWLWLAKNNPSIEFWAYTKSLKYWIKRRHDIPLNLILTASYGGKDDEKIEEYQLKNVKVYKKLSSIPKDRYIDYNDNFARMPNINFALLDWNIRERGQKIK